MGRILCRKAWTFVTKRSAERLRFLGVVLTLALVVSLLPAAVLADEQPSPPHRFYGTVTVYGDLPAPDGLEVSAWVGGEMKASCHTFEGM